MAHVRNLAFTRPGRGATGQMLSVGVPRDASGLDRRTGAGRVWHSVRPLLRGHVRVRGASPSRRRRPDVWLLPAQGRPVEAPEPVVAVIHGAAWMLDAGLLQLIPSGFAKSLVANTEATLERAAVAIVPSDYTRRALTEGFGMPQESVVVVPHGVDTAVFSPNCQGGRELVRAALGEERPYVLFASIPSVRQKNLVALKAAMQRLAEAGFPHALAIAGGTAGGESPELLREIAADLDGFPGRVAWLGHVPDPALAALMAQADAFCLPSLFEAFGLTALEALACGAPAVVSSAGALPEVVGDAAVQSDPTPAGLATALTRVLSDPELAARLRVAGPERAATLTWERTARGWLGALEHATNASPA
jgi:glycosyltransferase involved in cell wall biosynthesis